MKTQRLCLALLAAMTAHHPRANAQAMNPPLSPPGIYSSQSVTASNGVVVSVSAPASEVGVSILKRGGNAVDAAVATAFALAVTYPAAGNIGGGGFMLVHPAPGDGAPVAFDYRETAPATATPTMFAEKDSMYDHKAVATPGSVRGLEMAHRRFGTMKWSELILPAVALARDGFQVDDNLADLMNTYLASEPKHAEFQRVFGKPDGSKWSAGDRLAQPDLARTLQLLADGGPDAFYHGAIADGIVAEMKRGNGTITLKDLGDYQAIERQPLTTRYRGKYDVFVPPPASGGGTCLLEEMNILDSFNLKPWGRWSPTTMHVMAETMRRANLDRTRYLGDSAFVRIPRKLITPEYGRDLAKTISLEKATPSADLAADMPQSPEGHDTTHVSIIDAKGMAVANTCTIERLWGTRIVVKDMGFLLNNNMFGFNHPGLAASTDETSSGTANNIEPGKRPVSSMTPTIVTESGRVKLITGSPGSRGIPHTILCLMVNLFDFEMPVTEAVESPRISHQWMPDQLTFEAPERYPEMVKSLEALGHKVVRSGPRPQGDAHTIFVEKPNHYIGVADIRRSNGARAVGY